MTIGSATSSAPVSEAQAQRHAATQHHDQQQLERRRAGVDADVVVDRARDEPVHRLIGDEQRREHGQPGTTGRQLAREQECEHDRQRADQRRGQPHQRQLRERRVRREHVGGRERRVVDRAVRRGGLVAAAVGGARVGGRDLRAVDALLARGPRRARVADLMVGEEAPRLRAPASPRSTSAPAASRDCARALRRARPATVCRRSDRPRPAPGTAV